MTRLIEHRTGLRRPMRLDAVADYMPRHSSGRWWENFEVRTADVSAGGFQLVSTVPVQVGARVRIIPSTDPAVAEGPLAYEGEIVWVNEPAIPWLGQYRAGVAFVPAVRPADAPAGLRGEALAVA